MKSIFKILPFLLTIMLLTNLASCQNSPQNQASNQSTATTELLLAKTKTVFVDNAEKGEYATSMSIEQGTLKVGQKVDALGSGKKYSFEVKEIKVNDVVVAEASKTDNAFVILQTTEKAERFDAGFSIVNYGATSIPKSTEAGQSAASNASSEATCLFDDKTWRGAAFFNSHLFYAKGLSAMNCNNPYLMFGFKATIAPDNRQLLITVCGFEGKVGKVNSKNIEVSLSGSENGDSKSAEAAGNKNNRFDLEITRFEQTTNDEVTISGTFSGTLGGVLASKPIKIMNGIFTNEKVKVFNVKY